ncbi:hypothetical protein ACFX1W_034369 [Malus domestica]
MLVEKKLKTSYVAREGPPAAERIAQRRGPVMPLVPKFVPRYPLRAKFGSPLERLAIMKSDKVDYAGKVALRPTSPAAKTDSSAKK